MPSTSESVGLPLQVVNLGERDYLEVLELQRGLVESRRTGQLAHDVLLLVEHPHVVTLGRGAEWDHLVASPEWLRERGVTVVEVERGGDITYHGPGQLVGYPILDLHAYRLDLHWYLRRLEEVILRVLAGYRLPGFRVDGFTGVWTGAPGEVETIACSDGFPRIPADFAPALVEGGHLRKIASIGVHASRWITRHGFALNVTEEPIERFEWIVPCGISGVHMTSLHTEGIHVPVSDAAAVVSTSLASVFQVTAESLEAEAFVAARIR